MNTYKMELISKTLYFVKKGNPQKLHTIEFYLYDTLDKTKLWNQVSSQSE